LPPPATLTRAEFNAVTNRISLDAIPEAHTNAASAAATAAAEAMTLISCMALPPPPPPGTAASSPPAAAAAAGGDGEAKTDDAGVFRGKSGVPATNLGVVPWLPQPLRSLPEALPAAWREEVWFGGGADAAAAMAAALIGRWGDDTGGGGASDTSARAPSPSASAARVTPPSAGRTTATTAAAGTGGGGSSPGGPEAPAWTALSLNSIPPISARGQVVLILRRIYEALHTGGYQRQLPPPTAALAERYRRIAEFVPAQLRETYVLRLLPACLPACLVTLPTQQHTTPPGCRAAYTRRRQEALAIRAAMEAKKYAPR